MKLIRFFAPAFALLFFTSVSFPQNLSPSVQSKQQRVEYLSKKLGLSPEQTKAYISVLEESTNAANKIYRDTSLADSIKKEKLNTLYSERKRKLDLLFPNRAQLNQKRIKKGNINKTH